MKKSKQQPNTSSPSDDQAGREISLKETMRLLHERTGRSVAWDGHDLYTLDTSDYPRHLCADGTWRSLKPGARCADCEE